MIQARLALAVIALGFAATSAIGDEPDVYYPDHSPPGRPARIVAPTYPAEALAKGVTGYVDVEGRVDPFRKLKEVEYRPAASEAEAFVPALKEVIGRWEFYPVYGKNCMPGDERISVRVWFEIDQGKPHVSATVEKAPPKGASLKAISCPQPEYPRNAIRLGWMALIYAAVEVKPDGGVEKVEKRVYPDRGMGNQYFEGAVDDALSQCKFPAAEDGSQRRRVACYEIIFRLSND